MRTDTPYGSVVIASSSAALDTLASDETVSEPLLDVAPAAAPHQGRQASLSRLESLQARRRRRRLSYLRRLAIPGETWRNWTASVCASIGSRVSRRAPATRPPSDTPLEQQESKGFIVAVLLALTAVVYGGFLGVSWRERAQPGVPFAQSTARPPAVEAAMPAFHRCDVGVMVGDRALATCEGVVDAGLTRSRPATWTLEFRRTGGRWIIADVAMR
jgi:hypothetical protein